MLVIRNIFYLSPMCHNFLRKMLKQPQNWSGVKYTLKGENPGAKLSPEIFISLTTFFTGVGGICGNHVAKLWSCSWKCICASVGYCALQDLRVDYQCVSSFFKVKRFEKTEPLRFCSWVTWTRAFFHKS